MTGKGKGSLTYSYLGECLFKNIPLEPQALPLYHGKKGFEKKIGVNFHIFDLVFNKTVKVGIDIFSTRNN